MKKPKIARFAVINDERGLILGKDLGNIFEKGIVYEAIEILDTIVIKKIGPYALPDKGPNRPTKFSDVNEMVLGLHVITMTKEEINQAQNYENN